MERLVMHVDMDAIYAAIEQRDDPSLRGRPVIVGALPGGRGVVSTASYEAREFGIHSAMPISEAHRRCPDGVFLRPDFRRYKEASDQLMEVLSTISPVVEPISIDEAYVDVSGLGKLIGPPETIARVTAARICEATQLTASIGIGPNRVIAKIASDRHKPSGVTVVRPDEVVAFLAPLPLKDLRGVGRKTVPILERMGLRTVGDLQALSLDELQFRLGKHQGLALYRQAQGISSPVVGAVQQRKSISKETTFQSDEPDLEVIRETLLVLAQEVGRTARRTGLAGRKVTVKLRLPGFETHTRQRALEDPTQADLTIYRVGWELLRDSPFARGPFRLVGVGIGELVPDSQVRPKLFGKEDREKETRLYKVLDSICDRHGRTVIGIGQAGGRGKGEKRTAKVRELGLETTEAEATPSSGRSRGPR